MILLTAVPAYSSDISLYCENHPETKSEYIVHYDYLENGQLKGGIVRIPIMEKDKFFEKYEIQDTWTVDTLIENGPPQNRVDLVFLGDGYTSDEMDMYSSNVANVTNLFFNENPLSEYESFFNVHQVNVISNESGVDEPDKDPPIYRDTALDMTYNCGGTPRLLCVSISKARNAAELAPDYDSILVLANSSRYGGAGYISANIATLAGSNSSAVELALHEFGHSFGGLTDEYGGGDTYPGIEPPYPNVSIYNASEQLNLHKKWYRWLDLPNVDTFEGAYYYNYGIYRPTYRSKMRALNHPFGEVNVEQLIIKLYKMVSPIDDATPQSSFPLSAGTIFFVESVEPVNHLLDIQWYIDDFEIPDANEVTFCPADFLTGPGIYTVKVKVVDNTAQVRDEGARAAWLTESRQWQVEVLNGDIVINGRVDFEDFSVISEYWDKTGCQDINNCNGADIDGNNHVGFEDLEYIIIDWLR